MPRKIKRKTRARVERELIRAHHTPGPWQQGKFVPENFYQDYYGTIQEKRKIDEVEKKNVFSHFLKSDRGRTRKLVGTFLRKEDALLASFAPDLLSQAQKVLEWAEANPGISADWIEFTKLIVKKSQGF